MSNILLLNDAQHATVMAALRAYQNSLASAEKQNPGITDIATNDGTVPALTDGDIEHLLQTVNFATANADVLTALKHNGLTFTDCTQAFAADEENPFVKTAHELLQGGDDMSIDSPTVTCGGETGTWVMAWMWISNAEANVRGNADLLEAVWRNALAFNLQRENALDSAYSDWLEELVSNFADELDDIANAFVSSEPGPVVWQDQAMNNHEFLPSQALLRLVQQAKDAGMSANDVQQAECFCAKYGTKLDAILTVIQIQSD